VRRRGEGRRDWRERGKRERERKRARARERERKRARERGREIMRCWVGRETGPARTKEGKREKITTTITTTREIQDATERERERERGRESAGDSSWGERARKGEIERETKTTVKKIRFPILRPFLVPLAHVALFVGTPAAKRTKGRRGREENRRSSRRTPQR